MGNKDELNGKKNREPRLTVEELRQYKGFEKISDAEAIDYLKSMEQFCIIAYDIYKHQKQKQYEQSRTI